MDERANRTSLPLAVDLDGTVIATDLFWEALVRAFKGNPFILFLVPFWLLRGKAFVKQELARRVQLDATHLPYRAEFIEFLRAEKVQGRTLVLATGSPRPFAEAIAAHLGLFDQILASEGAVNLTSSRKRDALVAVFGDGGFDYAGNSRDDIKVFDSAANAVVVAPDRAAAKYQAANGGVLFAAPEQTFKTIFKLLRVHQWAKNVLIAVPAVLANELTRLTTDIAIVQAFISFSLLASAIYIINDLFDLDSDRRHKTKRNRPLAAGTVSIPSGVMIAVALIAVSIAVSLYLPLQFQLVLGGYAVLTTAYTAALKRMLLIDVLALAGLYTVRVIAGAAATQIDVSFWLLAFSVFFFLSLALVKRYVELAASPETETGKISGRGYRVSDRQVLAEAGIAATFSSVLVLALYIDSDQVKTLYERPYLIWLLCPIVLYLSLRIWVLARRGEMHEDPVVFILSDWRSQVMVLAGAVLVAAAAF
jgi:4-hydroxybenzoate polyprenyltransferase/phosphoglycolate phosphatase-like HAD superfamily hydrolase